MKILFLKFLTDMMDDPQTKLDTATLLSEKTTMNKKINTYVSDREGRQKTIVLS